MKLNKTFFLSSIVALLYSINISCQNDGWVEMFNGKDLSGWKKIGGNANYEVMDGEIVGISAANKYPFRDKAEQAKLTFKDYPINTFLMSEKAYSDFIVELELKVGNMNGGIQFRSNSDPEYFNGLFHGYQSEVDPSERAWSAGIYDEMGRAWLYPVSFNPDAHKALKLNDWNRYRIECIGNNIRTWLNDIPVAYLVDDAHTKGHFGLQVHFTFNEEQIGERIYWRNIRIKTENLTATPAGNMFIANYLPNNLSETEAKQGWNLLFDGKSTTGLKSSDSNEFPIKGWKITDGMLVATSDGEEIITHDRYEAFDLQFEFKTKGGGAEGGITYYSGSNTPGLEYLILDKDSVVDSERTASVRGLIRAKQVRAHPGGVKPSSWNRGRIVAYQDGKVEHWLNNEKVFEYVRGGQEFKDLVSSSKYAEYKDFGKLGEAPLKFGVRKGTINLRSIKIKELH